MSTRSFSQTALEHLDSLYGYALILTRDQTAAEDLVQETYLRAVSAFGQLVPNSNLKSWLFVIMRNAWLNQLRHNRSGPRFVELNEEELAFVHENDRVNEDPHVVYLRKIEREQIRAAIADLPELYREIIVLRPRRFQLSGDRHHAFVPSRYGHVSVGASSGEAEARAGKLAAQVSRESGLKNQL